MGQEPSRIQLYKALLELQQPCSRIIYYKRFNEFITRVKTTITNYRKASEAENEFTKFCEKVLLLEKNATRVEHTRVENELLQFAAKKVEDYEKATN